MQNIEMLQGLNQTLPYYNQVDVINEAVRLILLYNKCVKTVREYAEKSLQIALPILSRNVRRLAAFEKLLDQGLKTGIGENGTFL